MSTINKDFYLSGNLHVSGDATFNSDVILGTIPVQFNSIDGRIQIFVNGAWLEIAMLSDLNTQVSYSALPDVDYGGETE